MAEIIVEHGPRWRKDLAAAIAWAKRDDMIVVRSPEMAAMARAVVANLHLERTVVVREGAVPVDGGVEIDLVDPKGGDPDEWPETLRVRELPR
jgi:hypothetical protein